MFTLFWWRCNVIYTYHKDFTMPPAGEIFVFGSNFSGIHGAGAAKIAHRKYNAKFGVGFGPTGQSFAIPTKGWSIDDIPISAFKNFIDAFVSYTHVRKNQKFFVTRVGCGLAGYTDKDIAPLFRGCNMNCNFSEEWMCFLEGD